MKAVHDAVLTDDEADIDNLLVSERSSCHNAMFAKNRGIRVSTMQHRTGASYACD